MTTALAFQSTTFDVIDRNGQPWIQSKQLAQALGYKLENSVQKIYERNADEFTPAMSEKVNLTLSGNLTTAVRIFSLRGCHLIAMFARTPVAKAFRRWVLDVLDELNENGGIASPADLSSLSTAKSRKPLRGLVNAWAQLTGVHPSVLWPQVKAHFSLSRIDDLPEAWIPDALAFVQEKIDGLSRQREALPPPAAMPPQPMVQGTLSQGTLVPVNELPPIERKDGFAEAVVDKCLRGALEKLNNAFLHCQFMDSRTAPKESESRSLYIAAMCNIDAAGAILRAMIAAEKSRIK